MRTFGSSLVRWTTLALTLLYGSLAYAGDPATPNTTHVQAALENLLTLRRPGQIGLATVWDGDKYVQCRLEPDQSFNCEAAGALMQPSLNHVLTPERIKDLGDHGWRLDSSFGNYAQVFPAHTALGAVADRILLTLSASYGADLTDLGVRTDWVKDEPCPPRNGPSQNLAGVINDAPSMAATAIHACRYKPSGPGSKAGVSTEALIAAYGPRVTGEIQRLRVNLNHRVYFSLQADAGYVQCESQTPPAALYCEAESADSWSVLKLILTPDRVARLHAAGFTDPGRAPNYWKNYPIETLDDAAMAKELLTILHDVYGYDGSSELEIRTERGGDLDP